PAGRDGQVAPAPRPRPPGRVAAHGDGDGVTENHDDIAARLRDEASATAPERLRDDVMLRVRAEPRPQRLRPRRRSFGRPFATAAAAACIRGAVVCGLGRADLGGASGSSGAGATGAPGTAADASGGGGGRGGPSGTT